MSEAFQPKERQKFRETQEKPASPEIHFTRRQEPFIGHSAHPQPQEDFPFFLFFAMPTMIAATTATKTAQIITVAILSEIKASILFSPALHKQKCYFDFEALTFPASFADSL